MTRFLLDANIVSNVTRPQPSPSLLAWMDERYAAELFIASLTLAEIRRGILRLPAGRKRRELESWFDGGEGPRTLFAGRILPFDESAAMRWASLMAEGAATGRPHDEMDTIIAAVALVNGCTIVTNNRRDYRGLDTLDPTES